MLVLPCRLQGCQQDARDGEHAAALDSHTQRRRAAHKHRVHCVLQRTINADGMCSSSNTLATCCMHADEVQSISVTLSPHLTLPTLSTASDRVTAPETGSVTWGRGPSSQLADTLVADVRTLPQDAPVNVLNTFICAFTHLVPVAYPKPAVQLSATKACCRMYQPA
jgi:hypothetical protein